MSKMRTWGGVLAVVASAGMGTLACGGASESPDASSSIDSLVVDAQSNIDGAPPPDGGPPLDGTVPPDGALPLPDGAALPDAAVPLPDAAPLPVTVTAFNANGALAIGAVVILNNPDGSYIGNLVTNGAGQVVTALPAGGSVTGVLAIGSFRWLSTVLDVQPGDTIDLGAPYGAPQAMSVGTIQVTAPASVLATEATVGCSTGSFLRSGATLDVTTLCPALPDVLAVGLDAVTNDVIAYFFQKRVAMPGGAGAVAGAAWRTDTTASTISVSNAPAGTAAVRAESWAHAQGWGRAIATRTTALTVGGAGSFVLPMINDYPEVREHIVTATRAGMGSSAIRYRGAVAPATRSVNLGTELLPFPTAPTITSGIVAFTWSGGAGTPDGGLFYGLWTNPSEDRGFWSVIHPPGITSFALPDVPVGLVPDRPLAGATWNAVEQLTDFSGYAGWDAMRDASMRLITTSGAGAFTSGTLKQSISN